MVEAMYGNPMYRLDQQLQQLVVDIHASVPLLFTHLIVYRLL